MKITGKPVTTPLNCFCWHVVADVKPKVFILYLFHATCKCCTKIQIWKGRIYSISKSELSVNSVDDECSSLFNIFVVGKKTVLHCLKFLVNESLSSAFKGLKVYLRIKTLKTSLPSLWIKIFLKYTLLKYEKNFNSINIIGSIYYGHHIFDFFISFLHLRFL